MIKFATMLYAARPIENGLAAVFVCVLFQAKESKRSKAFS
jgi:hypothetical protein